MLQEKRGHDHPHAIVHPARVPQLAHTRIDDRKARFTALPAREPVRILDPREVCEVLAQRRVGRRRKVRQQVLRELAPYQLAQPGDMGLRHRHLALRRRVRGDGMPALTRRHFAEMQVRGQPRHAVDAGMRQLWQTGWMHNRVRMIVASFLVKHLLIDWREGERWFWDTLVDADLANNTLGWQWTAGCGADAAPYFRVFNPILQSTRFDPEGSYLRRWLPALARLPAADIHAPWQAPPLTLAAAGVRLGVDYPAPMLDHGAARTAALARLKRAQP